MIKVTLGFQCQYANIFGPVRAIKAPQFLYVQLGNPRSARVKLLGVPALSSLGAGASRPSSQRASRVKSKHHHNLIVSTRSMSDSAQPSEAVIAKKLCEVVISLYKAGNIDDLTVKRVRTRAEEQLGLLTGFLKSTDWKQRSRDIIVEAVVRLLLRFIVKYI